MERITNQMPFQPPGGEVYMCLYLMAYARKKTGGQMVM